MLLKQERAFFPKEFLQYRPDAVGDEGRKAEVGVVTVRQFEVGDATPRRATPHVIEQAFA